MLKIAKKLFVCSLLTISIVLSFVAVAYADDESVYVTFEEDNTVFFKSNTLTDLPYANLCISDPDKSVVYIGKLDETQDGYSKRFRLQNVKSGTYNATVNFKYGKQKKVAFCIKELIPVSSEITNLIISTDDIPDGFDKEIRLKYDCTQLELIDGCAFTYQKELSDCIIDDVGIEIKSIGDGYISFGISRQADQNLFEILNVIQFRQISEQPTRVTIVTEME